MASQFSLPRFVGLVLPLWLILVGGLRAQPVLPHVSDYSVRSFEYSPAWPLAKAVQFQQGWLIRLLLAANAQLARYQEPHHGQSMLYFAVYTHRYLAVRALLKGGADPNVAFVGQEGKTPLMEAAAFYGTSKYVRLLLAHGADPNLASRPPGQLRQTTPLIEAVGTRLESVQALVEQGAQVNYVTPDDLRTALGAAVSGRDFAVVRYLLVEQRADFRLVKSLTLKKDTVRIAELLKNLAYPLDSKEYAQKMELVRFLEERGIDYRGAPVPERYYRMYPKEFIDAY
ncbi:ankyrin repeat domain-containing protein [Hymenobacter sp. BT683]|uniref:Ankyrin repeat domain-containing protein n=1 Tax=Hymenobacter jeongseonensis TaxID=2791027 RepID=A0ABS0IFD7_9BACT|nr:ankyrin repeat domain-containing protein [Hymenobacter jeongseonensis]MBF9236540.1 ankyrin repeat domain-containing protein [Hymenobacter jeongseonensis]